MVGTGDAGLWQKYGRYPVAMAGDAWTAIAAEARATWQQGSPDELCADQFQLIRLFLSLVLSRWWLKPHLKLRTFDWQ